MLNGALIGAVEDTSSYRSLFCSRGCSWFGFLKSRKSFQSYEINGLKHFGVAKKLGKVVQLSHVQGFLTLKLIEVPLEACLECFLCCL